jgi:hypothetical protein
LGTVFRGFSDCTKLAELPWLTLAVVADRVTGDDIPLSNPISLPFPFPGVLVPLPKLLVVVLLKSSNLCNNISNPTSPVLWALPPTPAELSGVGADRDCLHGLFLGLDVSDGRDEHIDRGF